MLPHVPCKVCDSPVFSTAWITTRVVEPLCGRCFDWALGILDGML